jgi:hypothetical protein
MRGRIAAPDPRGICPLRQPNVYSDEGRGRSIAAFSLAVLALGPWPAVAVWAGGPAALYFAAGLPGAGVSIGLVIHAGWER